MFDVFAEPHPRRHGRQLAAAGMIVAVATPAEADPLTNPDEHCYSTTFAVYCDGPIQPDGT